MAQLLEGLSRDPNFLQMILQLSSRRQTHYMREFVSYIRDTPEERDQNLVNDRPHIVQRCPNIISLRI